MLLEKLHQTIFFCKRLQFLSFRARTIVCSATNNNCFLSLFFSRDFLTAEDKENIFNADHFPLWYRRAAEQIPGSFVYSIPFSTGLWFCHSLNSEPCMMLKGSQACQYRVGFAAHLKYWSETGIEICSGFTGPLTRCVFHEAASETSRCGVTICI